MTNYINFKIVKSRTTAAKRVSLAGIAIMLPGMLVAFGGLINESLQNGTAILISYISLIAGTIIATIGGRLAETWLIEPRNDQRLENALKGLDHRYRLVNYYTPAAHLLITPSGAFVAVVKDEEGPIAFDGRRWMQPFSFGRIWREWRHGGLGLPTAEAEMQIERLQKWLAPKMDGGTAEFKPLVLFSSPKAELEIADGHEYIMPITQLKAWMLKRRDQAMPADEYQRIVTAIGLADFAAEPEAKSDGKESRASAVESDDAPARTRAARKRKRRQK